MAVNRVKPGRGQESVWDYPRPPRLEPVNRRIRVIFNGETIVDSTNAMRVLETSHPPVYYIPQEDIKMEYLEKGDGRSWCEWKGKADYYTVRVGDHTAPNAAWSYPEPTPAFEAIRDYLAFYPQPMDRCLVDDEEAEAQPGEFYGGWITDDIVGPFKGETGTLHW